MKKISNAILLLSACYLMHACNDSSSSKTDSSTTTDSATSGMSSSTSTADTGSSGKMMDTSSSTSRMSDTSANASSTTNMNGQKPDKMTTDFMMKAASGGMMEVQLGQVAQDKAKSQRVKDFGSMLVADHTQANDELKSIASSKGIMIPAALMPAHQKHVDMLKMKSGADFDKAYMNMMLEDHKKDIADFKKASQSSTDADIKNFASKTLPVLQKHLDSAQAIHGKM